MSTMSAMSTMSTMPKHLQYLVFVRNSIEINIECKTPLSTIDPLQWHLSSFACGSVNITEQDGRAKKCSSSYFRFILKKLLWPIFLRNQSDLQLKRQLWSLKLNLEVEIFHFCSWNIYLILQFDSVSFQMEIMQTTTSTSLDSPLSLPASPGMGSQYSLKEI